MGIFQAYPNLTSSSDIPPPMTGFFFSLTIPFSPGDSGLFPGNPLPCFTLWSVDGSLHITENRFPFPFTLACSGVPVPRSSGTFFALLINQEFIPPQTSPTLPLFFLRILYPFGRSRVGPDDDIVRTALFFFPPFFFGPFQDPPPHLPRRPLRT